MDIPSEYHSLMDQAYGLTSADLNHMKNTHQKKRKESKNKKMFTKAISQDDSHQEVNMHDANATFEDELHDSSLSLAGSYSPAFIRANRMRSSNRKHKIRSSFRDLPSKTLPNLNRDRAMSCFDLRADPDHAEEIGTFKRRSKQRSSVLSWGAGTLGRRFKGVHRSLTSLMTGSGVHDSDSIVEGVEPAGDVSWKASEMATPSSGKTSSELVVSEPPKSPRAGGTSAWTDVRAAYHQGRLGADRGAAEGAERVRFRRVRAHRRAREVPLEDVMERSGLGTEQLVTEVARNTAGCSEVCLALQLLPFT